MSGTEHFESTEPPAAKRTKRRSALCDSIVATNPKLADKSDAELVAAHHRTIFDKAAKSVREWCDCQSPRRDEEYARRMGALRAMTLRLARADLAQLGISIEQADEISAAIIGPQDEYWAVLQTLNQRLFA
jgi:hypothetical protein